MTDCKVRGIRGATTVEENSPTAIKTATRELIERIVELNGVKVEDIASIFFTATPDLNAAPPAQAAREIGWVNTPLLCLQEMAVEKSLPLCIRVIFHWNTDRSIDDIRHVYLNNAKKLRPDLVKEDL